MKVLTKKQAGKIVTTLGINNLIDEEVLSTYSINSIIRSHVLCDWSGIPDCDKKVNEDALKSNMGTIMSSFILNDIKIWIMTYINDYTVIMLPQEY